MAVTGAGVALGPGLGAVGPAMVTVLVFFGNSEIEGDGSNRCVPYTRRRDVRVESIPGWPAGHGGAVRAVPLAGLFRGWGCLGRGLPKAHVYVFHGRSELSLLKAAVQYCFVLEYGLGESWQN